MNHLLFVVLLGGAHVLLKFQGSSALAINADVKLTQALVANTCHLFLDATLMGGTASGGLDVFEIYFILSCVG